MYICFLFEIYEDFQFDYIFMFLSSEILKSNISMKLRKNLKYFFILRSLTVRPINLYRREDEREGRRAMTADNTLCPRRRAAMRAARLGGYTAVYVNILNMDILQTKKN